MEGDEACDDGNLTDNDGCNADCQPSRCGDGFQAFEEACDDGNNVEGDGCDSNCTESFCGNGILSTDEMCDDGNTLSGDGCDSNCRPTGCGNGATGGTEECDDGNATNGDGCDANCKMTACGNAVMTDGEACDDGNTAGLDGCSATCHSEVDEVEPNEDGTPEPDGDDLEGNDFAITYPDTNGAFTGSTTILAAMTPEGDEDVFKFTNTGTTLMRLRLDVWNLATGYSIGMACGTSIDTAMTVRDAAGNILASNDDRDGANDRCSALSYGIQPSETVYIQVIAYGDATEIMDYALDVSLETIVCGDGDLGPGEQCDDSNAATGDGCSDTCQIEGAITEMEPNEDGSPDPDGDDEDGNDFATAYPDANTPITATSTVIASISPIGDEDVFKVTNTGAAPVNVVIDTWDLLLGIGTSCGTDGMDTVINVRDASGAIGASNNDRVSFSDYCAGGITYPLAAGQSIYVQVLEYGDATTITNYVLQVEFQPIVCGDSDVGLGEQCDDGNTMDGDGCDSMCQYEVVCGDTTVHPGEYCDDGNTMDGDGCSSMCEIEGATIEIEPNEDGSPSPNAPTDDGNDFGVAYPDANPVITGPTTIAAALLPTGDEDIFKITNTGTSAVNVALDIWDPALGIGTSCGTSGVDTVLNVRNAAGDVLASNNDRDFGDYCSSLTYPLLPGASFYAQVLDYQDNDTVVSYELVVEFIPVVCGDDDVGAGEQCDDGNTMDGDGCSSTCQVEGATSEIEPNEDGSPSVDAPTNDGNDFDIVNADLNPVVTATTTIIASFMPAGDEDVFKITNPGPDAVLVALDTWDLTKGIGVSCGTSGVDTVLNLRDATGAVLDSNNDRVSGDYCSALTYTLAPGESVYAQVLDWLDDDLVASYALQIRFTPIICGDGVLAGTEQCDDGNTVDGDGCTSTCMAIAEVEPNEDGATMPDALDTIYGNDFGTANPDANESFRSSVAIQGAIDPAGDEDIFKFTNTGTTSRTVRFDVWNGAPGYGVGVPCELSIDTGLVIRDSAGTELDSNDDRDGFSDWCSGLDFTIAAGESVYAHLVDRDDDDQIASYIFTATYLP